MTFERSASDGDTVLPSPGGGRVQRSAGHGDTILPGSAADDEAGALLSPGTSLAHGRYTVIEVLGCGGMGAVYRVTDNSLRGEVALKSMLPALVHQPSAAERFKKEVGLTRELAHDSIVKVYDYGEDVERSLCFYTMELLRGESLRRWLESRKAAGGARVDEALDVIAPVLEALSYAHGRGIVHRDLSPENVFVCRGERHEVKVLDFGIAKAIGDLGFTAGGRALGKALYMAPEQREDASSVDLRADLYSTAVILYELLTGRLPIGDFARPSTLRAGVPSGLDETVRRGLAPEPAGRHPSAAAFLAEVRNARAALAPRPPSSASRARALGWFDESMPAGLRRGAESGVYIVRTPGGLELELVYVPAGAFRLGSDFGGPGERPARAATMAGAIWIGRHPVTWREYCTFCLATGRPEPRRPDWAAAGRDLGAHPVVNVSWSDADEFCCWASLRLPTESEWEKAARGAEARRWPWGDAPPAPELCRWRDNAGPVSGTAPVGERPASASPCGAQDMAGNVWEWCAEAFADPDAGPAVGSAELRVVRGGAWSSPPACCRASFRLAAYRDRIDSSIGFRVALSSPELDFRTSTRPRRNG